MIARHLETLFCDDIRREVGDKLSFIGVYSGELLVQSFPTTLPKLCLLVRIITPADEPLCSLTLRILKDEETLRKIAFDDEQLATIDLFVSQRLGRMGMGCAPGGIESGQQGQAQGD